MTTPSAMMGSDDADTQLVDEVLEAAEIMQELGVSGLRRNSGYLDEEFLPQLKGRKAIQTFREMRDNDDIVGALMFAIIQLIRNTDFTVVPAGNSKEHTQAAKLVETCMDDMSHSWNDMVGEIVDGKLTYGWQWNEIVYKRRIGPWERDGSRRSKYQDGLIGWRKIPTRSQDTLQRWAFDESGGIQAMIQLGPPDYQVRVLPIERSLLFRFGNAKGSPEGRSMLRNAYRDWFYKKRLEEFESIGVERDLVGLPKVGVPASYLKAKAGSMEAKQVEALKRMVRGIRRNEQEGMIFPLAYDQETKQPLFTFDLVGSGGTRQFQTDALIQRYQTGILMTVLADFIKVGHENVGTYNMHADKTGIFKTALNSIAQSVADVFNRHAIPRLFAVNGWKPDELPKIVPSDVDAPDLGQLAGFLAQTAGLGFTWNDADMETFLRKAAGLPELGEQDEAKHRTIARRQEATRFAQSQIEYLATRSQLAQAIAAQKLQAAGEPSMRDVQEAQAVAQGTASQATAANSEQRAQEQHDTAQAAAQTAQVGAEISQTTQLAGAMTPPPEPASPAKPTKKAQPKKRSGR